MLHFFFVEVFTFDENHITKTLNHVQGIQKAVRAFIGLYNATTQPDRPDRR